MHYAIVDHLVRFRPRHSLAARLNGRSLFNSLTADPDDREPSTITFSGPEHDSTSRAPPVKACDRIECF